MTKLFFTRFSAEILVQILTTLILAESNSKHTYSLLRSSFLGCHATLPKTVAKETNTLSSVQFLIHNNPKICTDMKIKAGFLALVASVVWFTHILPGWDSINGHK